MATIQIHRFGFGAAEAGDKETLGGKGAGLCEMSSLGLPVPPGCVIPTSECVEYMKDGLGAENPLAIVASCTQAVLAHFGTEIKPKFGYMPLVSVRSGARVSMPGMMDTILNVGLSLVNIDVWANRIGERAAWDSLRRLYEMYGTTVFGIDKAEFDHYREAAVGDRSDAELTVDHLKKLVHYFDSLISDKDLVFPDKLEDQLFGAIEAVFKSWGSERAIAYRKAHKIPNDWGTAVVVQAMVFGNMNDQSGSGVLFSRDPSTGAVGCVGEFLPNAQGEDVVAGIRTPKTLGQMKEWNAHVTDRLVELAVQMEQHYRDMQDMEFTIQNGELFILQTRTGKRSARAAFKIAYDMVNEGLISKEIAVKRVNGAQYAALLKPVIDPGFSVAPHLVGLPASAGIVQGVAVFNAEQAEKATGPFILIRKETDPDDFPVMLKSVGILTATGGSTSHAAVVARGMDKPCVVGATDMVVAEDQASFLIDGHTQLVMVGDKVTIDGATGRVWFGVDVPVIQPTIEAHVEEIIQWALEANDVYVRVDAVPGKENLLPVTGNVVIGIRDYTTAEELKGLFAYLAEHRTLKGVLTTLPRSQYMGNDMVFLTYMYPTAKANDEPLAPGYYAKLAKVAGAVQWSKKFKDRFSFELESTAPATSVARMEKAGWYFVKTINSFGELFNAEGFVKLSEKMVALFQEHELKVQQTMDVLRKTGRNIRLVEDGVEKEEVVFHVLGGG